MKAHDDAMHERLCYTQVGTPDCGGTRRRGRRAQRLPADGSHDKAPRC